MTAAGVGVSVRISVSVSDSVSAAATKTTKVVMHARGEGDEEGGGGGGWWGGLGGESIFVCIEGGWIWGDVLRKGGG